MWFRIMFSPQYARKVNTKIMRDIKNESARQVAISGCLLLLKNLLKKLFWHYDATVITTILIAFWYRIWYVFRVGFVRMINEHFSFSFVYNHVWLLGHWKVVYVRRVALNYIVKLIFSWYMSQTPYFLAGGLTILEIIR